METQAFLPTSNRIISVVGNRHVETLSTAFDAFARSISCETRMRSEVRVRCADGVEAYRDAEIDKSKSACCLVANVVVLDIYGV